IKSAIKGLNKHFLKQAAKRIKILILNSYQHSFSVFGAILNANNYIWRRHRMRNKVTREELAQIILDEELLTNDATEIIEILKDTKVSKDLITKRESMTIGQRLADRITLFAGSWKFIIIFLLTLLGWIIFNQITGNHSFDPYPFILLNLVLSCVAAIQAP